MFHFLCEGYARVDRMLGNGRLIASCFDDGQQRLCHIRGKLRKKIWVNQGDVVLLGLREFQDGKADVIFKYSNDEARRLKQLGEIPENANIDPDPANAGNEDITFENAASSSGAEDSSEEEEEDLRAPGTCRIFFRPLYLMCVLLVLLCFSLKSNTYLFL